MLSRDFFGTFGLVLLDLSETVMSMTVTRGLDVFGAMQQLLAPGRVLAKNDYGYIEKLAKVRRARWRWRAAGGARRADLRLGRPRDVGWHCNQSYQQH